MRAMWTTGNAACLAVVMAAVSALGCGRATTGESEEDSRVPTPASAGVSSAPVSASRTTVAASTARARSGSDAAAVHRLRPFAFEANAGQFDARARFVARARGCTVFVGPDEAVLSLTRPAPDATPGPLAAGRRAPRDAERQRRPPSAPGDALAIRMVGADPVASVEGVSELRGRIHHLRGRDPGAWRTDVPTYERVACRDAYPGIDVVWYGRDGSLAFDFVVAPGADPGQIRLRYDGAAALRVEPNGDLAVSLPRGRIVQRAPVVYQDSGGSRVRVSGRYVLTGEREVGFVAEDWDRSVALVIDPTLRVASYLGGSGTEYAEQVTVDAAGNVYVCGETLSVDYPVTPGSFQPFLAASVPGGPDDDQFVTKLTPDLSTVLWSTYVGGDGSWDEARSFAVDADGTVVVVGTSNSRDFPRTEASPIRPENPDGQDGIVYRLASDGSDVLWATYVGGEGSWFDTVWDVALAADGAPVIVGISATPGLVGVGPASIQPTFAGPLGQYDAFLMKIAPDGSAIRWATYLGGDGYEFGEGVAIDGAGDVYACGYVEAADFPTVAAFQPALAGLSDGWVAKLRGDGSGLVWSSYLGGGGFERATEIVVDATGSAWVVGESTGPDFPGSAGSALQVGFGGGEEDAFVARVLPSGAGVAFSSFLGGSGADLFVGAALTPTGELAAVGVTDSTDFPSVLPFQGGLRPAYDGVYCRISADGSRLNGSTYLGGLDAGSDFAFECAATPSGTVAVVGWTSSVDFPVTAGAFQEEFAGPYGPDFDDVDGFVALIGPDDMDGDGLYDDWETYGYVTSDGTFVDLPSMGADPLHKDLFVEVDAMVAADHSHVPLATAMARVVAAFESAPVPNPDGFPGVRLHVLIDEALPHVGVLGTMSGSSYVWTEFDALKAAHFDSALGRAVHYCIFAHDLPANLSGISRGVPAADSIVALGSFNGSVGSETQQAGTFLHELGHNLGLQHGGDSSANRKPNYLSVMNYLFQLDGLRWNGADGRIDLSRFALPPLDENALDERVGLAGGPAAAGYGTKWIAGVPKSVQVVDNANGEIDWNLSGRKAEASVVLDVNDDLVRTTLTGWNDWLAIDFRGGAVGGGAPVPPVVTVADELDADTAAELTRPGPGSVRAHVTSGRVALTWSPEGPRPSWSYRVYRGKGGGAVVFLVETRNSEAKDDAVSPGERYTYRVSATGPDGVESWPSDPVVVTAR